MSDESTDAGGGGGVPREARLGSLRRTAPGDPLRRVAQLQTRKAACGPPMPRSPQTHARVVMSCRQGSDRRGTTFAQAPPDGSSKGERKKEETGGALRGRAHGGECARGDHFRLPFDRRLRPWIHRGPPPPPGVADRAL